MYVNIGLEKSQHLLHLFSSSHPHLEFPSALLLANRSWGPSHQGPLVTMTPRSPKSTDIFPLRLLPASACGWHSCTEAWPSPEAVALPAGLTSTLGAAPTLGRRCPRSTPGPQAAVVLPPPSSGGHMEEAPGGRQVGPLIYVSRPPREDAGGLARSLPLGGTSVHQNSPVGCLRTSYLSFMSASRLSSPQIP